MTSKMLQLDLQLEEEKPKLLAVKDREIKGGCQRSKKGIWHMGQQDHHYLFVIVLVGTSVYFS